jgi:hypothetical protein
VLFRVGAALVEDSTDLHPRFNIPNEALDRRTEATGDPAAGDAKENGVAARPTVYREGAFFAPD